MGRGQFKTVDVVNHNALEWFRGGLNYALLGALWVQRGL